MWSVIADEEYEQLVFETGAALCQMATLPGMFERTVTNKQFGESSVQPVGI
jgi:hypothetical protein